MRTDGFTFRIVFQEKSRIHLLTEWNMVSHFIQCQNADVSIEVINWFSREKGTDAKKDMGCLPIVMSFLLSFNVYARMRNECLLNPSEPPIKAVSLFWDLKNGFVWFLCLMTYQASWVIYFQRHPYKWTKGVLLKQ